MFRKLQSYPLLSKSQWAKLPDDCGSKELPNWGGTSAKQNSLLPPCKFPAESPGSAMEGTGDSIDASTVRFPQIPCKFPASPLLQAGIRKFWAKLLIFGRIRKEFHVFFPCSRDLSLGSGPSSGVLDQLNQFWRSA